MHVVHVASGRLFGGIEQMLLTIARERALTPAVSVTFAVAAPGRLEDELRSSGADVTALGDVRLSRPASVVTARRRLRARLVRERADAVICHAPWAYAIFAGVARRAGVPPVLWQHDRAEGSAVERWAARTPAALVICNSTWTSRTAGALQHGVPVTVIHPPVRVPECPGRAPGDLRVELDTDPTDVVILSASRLEPWKGHLNLVRALARLRTTRPWKLWLAGGAQRPHEHEYLESVRREVTRLDLEPRVRFLGERRDVPLVMRAADVFCQANDGPEPFGIVFAEALLSGVPVVTTDMGGAPEIVSEACGRLVPAGDVDALSRVLGELVDDSGLRSGLGVRGPAHAAARSAPAVVLPQIEAAIARLCLTQTA